MCLKRGGRCMSDDVKIFEGSQIRSVWDNEREEWYFSVVDVIGSLTESNNPRDYWYRVKKRMSEEEKSELSTICRLLKLKAPDGKMRLTDVADMQGIINRLLKMAVLSLVMRVNLLKIGQVNQLLHLKML